MAASAAEPTIVDLKRDLDELRYQAENMRHYRWLLGQYLRPTLDNSGEAEAQERPPP
ncbi:MAG: hypothetical protein ACM33U_07570 [Solirubrobacterales bacterium]|nr:hypothetical protein [Solirubrobacterales bacterium]